MRDKFRLHSLLSDIFYSLAVMLFLFIISSEIIDDSISYIQFYLYGTGAIMLCLLLGYICKRYFYIYAFIMSAIYLYLFKSNRILNKDTRRGIRNIYRHVKRSNMRFILFCSKKYEDWRIYDEFE